MFIEKTTDDQHLDNTTLTFNSGYVIYRDELLHFVLGICWVVMI